MHGRLSLAARAAHPGEGSRPLVPLRRTAGWYDLKVRIARHGGGRYALDLTKSG